MVKAKPLLEIPLIEQPIEHILVAARTAGHSAFEPREVIGTAWEDAAFAWLETTIPESLDLSDDAFKNLAEKVQAAFKAGIEDRLYEASRMLPTSLARLPGVGYWFFEDSSFAFGLMVDMSKLRAEDYDAARLFDRFYNRLLSEYDRLAEHLAASRANGVDVYHPDLRDEPLSISLPRDETLFLEIVPASIDRTALLNRLPPILTEYVRMLGEDWQPADA